MSVNNNDCTRMSRIEAWNFMKKLSDGSATLVVRQKILQDCGNKEQAKALAPQAQKKEEKTDGSFASSSSSGCSKNSNNISNDNLAKREEGTTKVDRTVEETKHI